jgi:hypothetical protein
MTTTRGDLDAGDERRLAICLQKVDHLLRPAPFAVCGGIAVQLALAQHGWSRPDHRLKDVDILAVELDHVSPERFDGWLLSHFHRPHPGYDKRFVQLVDRDTRLRVDVFHDARERWRDAAPHQFGDVSVLVLGARQVLTHKRRLIEAASVERPIDPKHFEDARLLASLFGESEPKLAVSYLRSDVYGTDLSAPCRRCMASMPLPVPLAPKTEILSLLGYV